MRCSYSPHPSSSLTPIQFWQYEAVESVSGVIGEMVGCIYLFNGELAITVSLTENCLNQNLNHIVPKNGFKSLR